MKHIFTILFCAATAMQAGCDSTLRHASGSYDQDKEMESPAHQILPFTPG